MKLKVKNRFFNFFLIVFVFMFFMVSCDVLLEKDTDSTDNEDNGNSQDVEDDSSDEEDDSSQVTADPLTGYNLNLESGSWWKFYWEKDTFTSWYSSYDSDSSSSESSGYLIITLGDEVTIEGRILFQVELSGDIPSFNTDSSFWQYIGSDEGDLIGSLDGINLKTILNSSDRSSEYSFFLLYSESLDITSSSFSAEYPAEYSTDTDCANFNSSYDDSIIIPGYDPIDGDVLTYTISEHYKAGVGPVGITLYDYLKDVTSSNSWEIYIREWSVNLVSTSLSADDGFSFPQPAWDIYGEMPEVISCPNVILLNNSLYIVGGNLSYDPVLSLYKEGDEGEWIAQSSIPDSWNVSTSGSLSGACLAYPTGSLTYHIYFTASFSNGLNIYDYNPFTDNWSIKYYGNYTGAIYSCFSWGNNLIYSVGFKGRLLEYDLSSSTFEDIGFLMDDFTYINAVSDGDKIFLVGQYEPYFNGYQTGIQYYNGTTWIQVYPGISNKRRWHPGLAIYNDRLYILGGTEDGRDVISAQIDSDGLSDWMEHSPMLYGGSSLNAITKDNKIYVFGTDEGSKIEVFDPLLP